MKKWVYTFKSIRVDTVEKPVLGTGYSRMALEFDMASVQEHHLELGLLQILRDRTWKMNVSLSAMVIFAVFSLLYGLLKIGLRVDFGAPEGALVRNIYILSLVLSFLFIWILFSLRFGITNLKKEAVEKERGPGTWKLIDEKEWDRFYRLWKLAREKEEKDLEEFKNKLATKDTK